MPALHLDSRVREVARCHGLDMAEYNFFSHFGHDGPSPQDRFAHVGFSRSVVISSQHRHAVRCRVGLPATKFH